MKARIETSNAPAEAIVGVMQACLKLESMLNLREWFTIDSELRRDIQVHHLWNIVFRNNSQSNEWRADVIISVVYNAEKPAGGDVEICIVEVSEITIFADQTWKWWNASRRELAQDSGFKDLKHVLEKGKLGNKGHSWWRFHIQ